MAENLITNLSEVLKQQPPDKTEFELDAGNPSFDLFSVYLESTDPKVHQYEDNASTILYVSQGNVTVTSDQQELPLRAGNVVFLTKDQHYSVKNDNRKTILTKLKFAHFDYEQYFDTFDTEDKREQTIIKELDQQLNNQHFIWFKSGKEMHSARMMDRVIHEYLSDEVFGEALVKAQLKLIFVMSLRSKIASKKREKKFNQEKFEQYIEENLATATLQDAAAKFGFNMNYFSNLVKRTLGQNFSSYLNQQKMERAKELVVSGNDPIKDIITALGYSSWANFYWQFNEYYGETPAGMRKRLTK